MGDFQVTTALDENDAGATPADPGGDGLSFREAVALSNATAGVQSITFESSLTIALESGLIVTDAADIRGNATEIDCSPIGGAVNCLTLSVSAGATNLQGVAFSAARNAAIRITTGGDYTIADCELVGSGNGIELSTVVTSLTVTRSVISGNDGDGISAVAGTLSILDNQFFDNANRAIYLGPSANDTRVIGNLIVRGQRGVVLGNGVTGVIFRHDTFVSTTDDALTVGSGHAAEIANCAFAYSGGYGIVATNVSIDYRDYNAYYRNVADCSNCDPEQHIVTADPRFASLAVDDYTLAVLSPLIDAGIDRGEDRNGASGGLFNGLAPDIGYWESP